MRSAPNLLKIRKINAMQVNLLKTEVTSFYICLLVICALIRYEKGLQRGQKTWKLIFFCLIILVQSMYRFTITVT